MSVQTISAAREHATPVWLIPVVSVLLGAAGAAALFSPLSATPDYQRGSRDGFKAGYFEASESFKLEGQRLYESGIEAGVKQSSL